MTPECADLGDQILQQLRADARPLFVAVQGKHFAFFADDFVSKDTSDKSPVMGPEGVTPMRIDLLSGLSGTRDLPAVVPLQEGPDRRGAG